LGYLVADLGNFLGIVVLQHSVTYLTLKAQFASDRMPAMFLKGKR
jgi:hypothetical protein